MDRGDPMKLAAFLVVIVVAALTSCVQFQDRCAGVVCGDGQVCLDLASGPRCVCDQSNTQFDAGTGSLACASSGECEG